MAIVDEEHLLSDTERKGFRALLEKHGFEPEQFLLEVSEDQSSMDMNDIKYVVIVKTIATHKEHGKSKSYYSRASSGTWLIELEEDLREGYFQA